MTQTHTADDVKLEVQRIIGEMRDSMEGGEPWFEALLRAIRSWPLASEQDGERSYRYLVGGEAFDWLLLAERLCGEVSDLIPDGEEEALLFHERLPVETSEEDFQVLLGAKYKPHLNFVYGVRVEAALQMAVLEEIRKERSSTAVWEKNGRADDEAFERIYGTPRSELLEGFREAHELDAEWLSLADYSEWRYWLFQYRVKNCDPAKVASDTRKGLLMLQSLERDVRLRDAARRSEG
ncbi:MAG TPA: hypothetical protein VMR52_10305 [Dehalococcoidia bacterium]|nr:hypothetical protein [Dehalococcoidia bacterium]